MLTHRALQRTHPRLHSHRHDAHTVDPASVEMVVQDDLHCNRAVLADMAHTAQGGRTLWRQDHTSAEQLDVPEAPGRELDLHGSHSTHDAQHEIRILMAQRHDEEIPRCALHRFELYTQTPATAATAAAARRARGCGAHPADAVGAAMSVC